MIVFKICTNNAVFVLCFCNEFTWPHAQNSALKLISAVQVNEARLSTMQENNPRCVACYEL